LLLCSCLILTFEFTLLSHILISNKNWLIPGGAKNALNICMHYSAEWSKWISSKAFM